jgi:hypothetical protein
MGDISFIVYFYSTIIQRLSRFVLTPGSAECKRLNAFDWMLQPPPRRCTTDFLPAESSDPQVEKESLRLGLNRASILYTRTNGGGIFMTLDRMQCKRIKA